jgi:hypothetical protein
VSAAPGTSRDWTWMLALATLSLTGAVWAGRCGGRAFDFLAGFCLGVALAVSFGYLVITPLRRRSS